MARTAKRAGNFGTWVVASIYWAGVFATSGAIYFATPHLISSDDHHRMALDVVLTGAAVFAVVGLIWKGLGVLLRVPDIEETAVRPQQGDRGAMGPANES